MIENVISTASEITNQRPSNPAYKIKGPAAVGPHKMLAGHENRVRPRPNEWNSDMFVISTSLRPIGRPMERISLGQDQIEEPLPAFYTFTRPKTTFARRKHQKLVWNFAHFCQKPEN